MSLGPWDKNSNEAQKIKQIKKKKLLIPGHTKKTLQEKYIYSNYTTIFNGGDFWGIIMSYEYM